MQKKKILTFISSQQNVKKQFIRLEIVRNVLKNYIYLISIPKSLVLNTEHNLKSTLYSLLRCKSAESSFFLRRSQPKKSNKILVLCVLTLTRRDKQNDKNIVLSIIWWSLCLLTCSVDPLVGFCVWKQSLFPVVKRNSNLNFGMCVKVVGLYLFVRSPTISQNWIQ